MATKNLSEYNGRTYAFTVSESSNTPTGGNIYDGTSYTAIMPIAYMDLDGNVHDFTEADLDNPELSRLVIRSGNIYVFAKDGYDPYFSANLSITKEIGDHVSVSFYANNFFNNMKTVHSSQTGLDTSLFSSSYIPSYYYGLSLRLKL